MRKEKLAYKAPTSEAFVIRFEGNLCLSGGKKGDPGKAGGDWLKDEDFNDYGDL